MYLLRRPLLSDSKTLFRTCTSHQMSNNMALTPLQTSHSYTNSPQPLSYNPFFQTASPASQTAANPYYSHTAHSTPIQPTRSFSPGNPFANSLSAQNTGSQQNLAFSQSRLAMPRHANTMPVFSSTRNNHNLVLTKYRIPIHSMP